MRWTVFMLLKTRPDWLALNRTDRARIAGEAFASALPDDRVRLRYFDAEAFSGKCTDVAMFETDDLQAYYFAVERLRDTPLFSHPYFEVVEIIPAMEDGFRTFEASEAA